jgi:hypothetical protein
LAFGWIWQAISWQRRSWSFLIPLLVMVNRLLRKKQHGELSFEV